MNENKIEIRNLSKAFGKKVVLDGIDLDVKRGNLWWLSADPVPENQY